MRLFPPRLNLRRPDPRFYLATLILLVIGALGGEIAKLAHVPLPWMIGSLVTSALIAMFQSHRLPQGYVFPMGIRMIFIAVIGTLIGAQVDLSVLADGRALLISLGGLTLFVFAAHGLNYALFRRAGGYDRPTAFFCAAPGGLIESIALGEKAGADLRLLTLQQFLRIIVVVTLLPIGLSLWHGAPLGSAAGLSLVSGTARLSAIPLLLAVAAGGLLVGRVLHLPAAPMTGPLLLAGVLSALGLVDLNPPDWVIAVAQVVIGVSLGVRFFGMTGAMMRRGLWLSLLSVGAMLVLAAGFALVIHGVTGQSTEVLILSFAPGGVTEMGLVALSLAANPAVVALHHLYRISLTVIEMSVVARWLR